jgi:mannose-6-phosphate isomerase-like protein (cupin superfamily)
MTAHSKKTNSRNLGNCEVAKYREDVVHIDLGRLKECLRWLFGKGEALYNSDFMSLHYNETEKGWTEADPFLHYHREAEEYYISLEGCLTIQVGNSFIKVEPFQLLKVNPKVPHGVVHVETPFRGFTIRAPISLGDKVVLKNKKLGQRDKDDGFEMVH